VNEFHPGLEGVIAFETEIAEPDREGSALRYRGVDVEELVGHYPFEKVWGLLVDGRFEPGMPHAERIALQDPSGSVMADLQAALATLGPKWRLRQLVDITPEEARDDLARLSAAALSIVAQAARGGKKPVPEAEVAEGENAASQFLIRWRGEADPRHVRAVDTYWVSAAEHGMNASTFTARIAASTGADCAAALSSAVGALSGPLHGGAPTRVLKMLDEVEASGDAEAYVHAMLGRGERIMGFGHRVYKNGDPRAVILREYCRQLAEESGSTELEQIADTIESHVRGEKGLPPNLDWPSARLYHYMGLPVELYTPLFVASRVVGWAAHVIEQTENNRLIRPRSNYIGLRNRSFVPLPKRG
jgi:citrate synthase